ncbi:MAG TPA: DUF58 domain-containing protein [Candidatus Binatia bacterium]|nr:DUF58 domain-containing protein [Candidatus Binatia bacterium]
MSSKAPLLAVILVLSFFAAFTGVHLAYTLAYALLLLLIVAWVWSWRLTRRIEVRRETPQGAHMVGEAFVERFTVRNRSMLTLPYCEVHDRTRIPGYMPGRACSLNPNGSVTWTARGIFTRRGKISFGPLEVRLGDPFGLFPRTLRIKETGLVTVYPAIHPVDALLGPVWIGGSLGEFSRGRPLDIAPDVSSVREYAPEDGLNRIHWASTARAGRLISRLYETRQSTDILVVLDLCGGTHYGDEPESSLEYAVSLAASIAHAALSRGQAVGLVANDRAGTAIGPGRGDSQRLRIMEFLAIAQDNGRQPVARTIARHGLGWQGRGGLIVVTSDRDPGWVEALVEVGTKGRRHLAVFVEPTSFGAPGSALRISAAWRLALDWWVVRRGDVLSAPRQGRVAGL